jgi:uncharacterized protein YndB with AHSA1/START domain
MGRTESIAGVVDASPDETFAFLTDLDRLPEWNAIMVGVVERPDALVPGAEWVVEFHALGRNWHSRSKLEELAPDRRVFAYRSQTDDGNPSYAIWRWQVEPAAGGGSQVTASWDLRPQTFWRRVLLSRVRSRQLRREVPASIDSIGRAIRASTG